MIDDRVRRQYALSLAISAALPFATPLEEQLPRMRGLWLPLQGALKRGLKLGAEECKRLIALLRTL